MWSSGELQIIQGQNWLNLLQFFAENVLNWVKWFWVNSRLSKYGECSILSSDTWCKGLTSNWTNLFPDKSNVFKLVKDWQNSTGKYEISLWAKSRCLRMDPNAWKIKWICIWSESPFRHCTLSLFLHNDTESKKT